MRVLCNVSSNFCFIESTKESNSIEIHTHTNPNEKFPTFAMKISFDLISIRIKLIDANKQAKK